MYKFNNKKLACNGQYLKTRSGFLNQTNFDTIFTISDICDLLTAFVWHLSRFSITIIRTLKEDQPLRLLLNLLFYHFNCSEPTYKSQNIKLLAVIAACNQVNRELKQTDAAAERRRSTSKFLFRRTQGQVNSVGP